MKNRTYYAIMVKIHPEGIVEGEQRLELFPKKKDAQKALKSMGEVMEDFYSVFKVELEVKVLEEVKGVRE